MLRDSFSELLESINISVANRLFEVIHIYPSRELVENEIFNLRKTLPKVRESVQRVRKIRLVVEDIDKLGMRTVGFKTSPVDGAEVFIFDSEEHPAEGWGMKSKLMEEISREDYLDIANSRLGWAVAQQLKSILDATTPEDIEDAELNHNAIRMIYRFALNRTDDLSAQIVDALEAWEYAEYGELGESKVEEGSGGKYVQVLQDMVAILRPLIGKQYDPDKLISNFVRRWDISREEAISFYNEASSEEYLDTGDVFFESKTNEKEVDRFDAEQTMKPQEEDTEVLPPDTMEDYSDEGEEEKGSKSKGTENELTEIPDKPVDNEVAYECTDALHLCNTCFSTFRNTESKCTKSDCGSTDVERLVPLGEENIPILDEESCQVLKFYEKARVEGKSREDAIQIAAQGMNIPAPKVRNILLTQNVDRKDTPVAEEKGTVGLMKKPFNVNFTRDGKEEETVYMGFDEADVKREMEKNPKVKVQSVVVKEGKISEGTYYALIQDEEKAEAAIQAIQDSGATNVYANRVQGQVEIHFEIDPKDWEDVSSVGDVLSSIRVDVPGVKIVRESFGGKAIIRDLSKLGDDDLIDYYDQWDEELKTRKAGTDPLTGAAEATAEIKRIKKELNSRGKHLRTEGKEAVNPREAQKGPTNEATEEELDKVAQDMFGMDYQELPDYDHQQAVKDQIKISPSSKSKRIFTKDDIYTDNYGKLKNESKWERGSKFTMGDDSYEVLDHDVEKKIIYAKNRSTGDVIEIPLIEAIVIDEGRKEKPPKKYTEEEQLKRRKEASKVIRGENPKEAKVKEQEDFGGFNQGWEYAKLTHESNLPLDVVLDLVEDLTSEDFKKGYQRYMLEVEKIGSTEIQEQESDKPTLKQQQDVMARLKFHKSWYKDLDPKERAYVDDKLSDYKESKLQEQDYTVAAKGVSDEDDAREIARKREGQVVQDEEDENKFQVIVRKET
jgi:hypothetical protein